MNTTFIEVLSCIELAALVASRLRPRQPPASASPGGTTLKASSRRRAS
jgi:hypothetical protein